MSNHFDAYDQNALNRVPLDLLSYTLPGDSTQRPTEQEISSTFFSTIEEQNNNMGGVKSNISSPGLSYFYNQNHISPLDASALPDTALSNILPTPDYCAPNSQTYQDDGEEFLTPLVSPAITPNFADIYEFLDPPSDMYFTPLSSPALPANNNRSNSLGGNISPTANMSTLDTQNTAIFTQQLAQIESKQQMLREQLSLSPTSPKTYRKSPLALFSNRLQAPPSPLPFNSSKKRPSLRQQIALASPQLHSSHQHHIHLPNTPTTPATPASLMKINSHPPSSTSNTAFTNNTHNMVDSMPSLPPAAFVSPDGPSILPKKRKLAPSSPAGSSPRTLKPLISPFLQPAASTPTSPCTPGLENRRSAHKVAEQKRRDTLKQSFDSLREEIADILILDAQTYDDKKPEEAVRKEVKLMSKVLLLQHSYEYIVRLKTDGKSKDEKMEKMQAELDRLKKLDDSK